MSLSKRSVTRLRVQTTPCQWQGVGSESNQESRTRVGSVSIADLRARRERPSGLRHSTTSAMRRSKAMCRKRSIFIYVIVGKLKNASVSLSTGSYGALFLQQRS